MAIESNEQRTKSVGASIAVCQVKEFLKKFWKAAANRSFSMFGRDHGEQYETRFSLEVSHHSNSDIPDVSAEQMRKRWNM